MIKIELSERQIEKYFVDAFKRKFKSASEGIQLKWASTFFTGMPDRIIMLNGGRLFFVELKSPVGALGIRQIVVHRMLRVLGFSVAVLNSKESINEYLNNLN